MKEYDFSSVAPETMGISSRSIIRFIDELNDREIFTHSFMIMRHGRVVSECYYKPWTKDTLQRLYSSSKSVTAVAICFLLDAGLVSLDDPIWRFFPEYPPETLHPWTRAATVRDALTMRLPFSRVPYSVQNNGQWIESFFRVQPDHPSGTVWYYDTCAAQMLAEIVKRVTGMPFYKYLQSRLPFEHYMENADCVCAPDGSEFAGSGLRVKMRDFALTANLMCQGGVLDGVRYLSEDIVTQATTPQSFNDIEGNGTMSTKGYGYQIWCGEDCFMFKGMANQFAVCFPKKELTLVTNCNTRGNKCAYEIVYSALKHLIIDDMADSALPEDTEALNRLRSLENSMSVVLPKGGQAHSQTESAIDGQKWLLDGHAAGVTEMTVSYDGEEGTLSYKNATGDWKIRFGCGYRLPFLFREHHPDDPFTGKTLTPEYTCFGLGQWLSPDTLRIRVEFEGQYMGWMLWVLVFKEDTVGLYVHHDLDMFPNRWFLNRYEGYGGGKADK